MKTGVLHCVTLIGNCCWTWHRVRPLLYINVSNLCWNHQGQVQIPVWDVWTSFHCPCSCPYICQHPLQVKLQLPHSFALPFSPSLSPSSLPLPFSRGIWFFVSMHFLRLSADWFSDQLIDRGPDSGLWRVCQLRTCPRKTGSSEVLTGNSLILRRVENGHVTELLLL